MPEIRVSLANLEGEALRHDERHGAAARRSVHESRQMPPVPPRQDLPHRIHQLHVQSNGQNSHELGI